MPLTLTELYAACKSELEVLMVFATTSMPPLDSDTVAAKFPRMMYLNAVVSKRCAEKKLIGMVVNEHVLDTILAIQAVDWYARTRTNILGFSSNEVVTAANDTITIIQGEITRIKLAINRYTDNSIMQLRSLKNLNNAIANIEMFVRGFGFILHPDSYRLS